MAKTKKAPTSGLVAVVGLNIGTIDGELRFEPGEAVPVELIEPWMVDDGSIVDLDAPADKGEVVVNVDSLDTDDAAAVVTDALNAQDGGDA